MTWLAKLCEVDVQWYIANVTPKYCYCFHPPDRENVWLPLQAINTLNC